MAVSPPQITYVRHVKSSFAHSRRSGPQCAPRIAGPVLPWQPSPA